MKAGQAWRSLHALGGGAAAPLSCGDAADPALPFSPERRSCIAVVHTRAHTQTQTHTRVCCIGATARRPRRACAPLSDANLPTPQLCPDCHSDAQLLWRSFPPARGRPSSFFPSPPPRLPPCVAATPWCGAAAPPRRLTWHRCCTAPATIVPWSGRRECNKHIFFLLALSLSAPLRTPQGGHCPEGGARLAAPAEQEARRLGAGGRHAAHGVSCHGLSNVISRGFGVVVIVQTPSSGSCEEYVPGYKRTRPPGSSTARMNAINLVRSYYTVFYDRF